ncbi:MAG: hypothetical protein KIT11_05830 [Fimbriimonadaceae bacterium]|nr:hypothetical protein [Fimbriimonadaceae bacterium]QYK55880.1 MAG: hypothetical protein KF733_00020 [Fimbriimonadaceae bacterium]
MKLTMLGLVIAALALAVILRVDSADVTAEEAASRCRALLKKLKIEAPTDAYTCRKLDGGDFWHWQCSVVGGGRDLFILVTPKGDVVRINDGQLSYDIARNVGANKSKAFESELEAATRLREIVDAVRGECQVRRTDFKFVQNGSGDPPRRTKTYAAYEGLTAGYPVVSDVSVGCRITLCAQTGRFIDFHQSWQEPDHRDPARLNLDEAAARSALAKVAKGKHWAQITPKVGWAKGSGGRYRLAWRFVDKGDLDAGRHPSQYFIDAETGSLLRRDL